MTFTQIYVENNRRKGDKFTVSCPTHGRIAVRYVEQEATTIAEDHEIAEHRTPKK